jgi:hypothetical protein
MPQATEETYFFPDNSPPVWMQNIMKSTANFEKLRVTLPDEKKPHLIFNTTIKGAKFQKELLINNHGINSLLLSELTGDKFKEMKYRDYHQINFPWIEGSKLLTLSYYKVSATELEIGQLRTFNVAWEELAQAEECDEDPQPGCPMEEVS